MPVHAPIYSFLQTTLLRANSARVEPLEEHAGFLLGLITEPPDLTLDELVAAMWKRGIPECGLAVLRSTRHQPQKKLCTLRSKSARRLLASARGWIRRQGMFDPAQLVFIDESWTNTSMVRLRGRCPRGGRLIGYAPLGHWKTITFVAGLRIRVCTHIVN